MRQGAPADGAVNEFVTCFNIIIADKVDTECHTRETLSTVDGNVSQIPQFISQIAHNAPLRNRNVHTFT